MDYFACSFMVYATFLGGLTACYCLYIVWFVITWFCVGALVSGFSGWICVWVNDFAWLLYLFVISFVFHSFMLRFVVC